MTVAIPGILAKIVDHKRAALARQTPAHAELERKAADRHGFREFRKALTSRSPAILAEIKKASPSKGILAGKFDPASIAKMYAQGGAAALSALTDEEFFQGAMSDLEASRAAVALPVLRKDFTIDEFHIIEAAAHGADAVLLIAAILSVTEMRRFRELAARFHMAALAEVHDEDELAAALDSGAEIIGVNNRNLHTFEVSLDTSLRLVEKMPANIVKVAESGIHSRRDIERLQAAGLHAFLVGEHLMKAADPVAALRALQS